MRHRRGQGPAGPRRSRKRPRTRPSSRRSPTATPSRRRRSCCASAARYRAFGLYETAILGMLAQSTGWATAAASASTPPPPSRSSASARGTSTRDVTDALDYAAIVGGCVGASTPAGARLAGLRPTGTMPHSLVLIFGDTVRAAEAFDRHVDPGRAAHRARRHVPDEAEEALRVAHALGDRLYGVRLDTPAERGRVTRRPRPRGPRAARPGRLRPRQDHRLGRARARSASGTSRTPARRSTRTRSAATSAAPRPIDFTGDLKEIDGRAIAKRGRIPGVGQPAPGTGRPRRLAGRLSDPARGER